MSELVDVRDELIDKLTKDGYIHKEGFTTSELNLCLDFPLNVLKRDDELFIKLIYSKILKELKRFNAGNFFVRGVKFIDNPSVVGYRYLTSINFDDGRDKETIELWRYKEQIEMMLSTFLYDDYGDKKNIGKISKKSMYEFLLRLEEVQ